MPTKALSIRCKKHPRYRATRRSAVGCPTCHLLFILRWQNTKEAENRLGGLNPYQFINIPDNAHLDDVCWDLVAFER